MPSIADPRALANLLARLETVRPDTPRRWGTLTPLEMLCHLGDAAERVLAREPENDAPARPLRRWIGLCSPLPWPRGARSAPGADPRSRATKPTDFEHERRRAIAGLRELSRRPEESLRGAHALFGRMTARDWWRWAYKHTDHHLRQFGQ